MADRPRSPRPGAVVVVVTGVALAISAVVIGGGSPSTTLIAPTTTTTTATERAQPGWAVVAASARGVMVDTTIVVEGAARFLAVRLRARSTLLRWHVGVSDPRDAARAPVDAAPSIDWPSEGTAGVVAVFNGGFEQSAHAGGSMADGLVLVAPVPGDVTIALDAAGHWAMGVWGAASFPPAGFRPISLRQNLVPLVLNARPTALAAGPVRAWGSPLHGPLEPRTGLGVDASGNLIDVATTGPASALDVARALVAAGAVTGMELDINPFWPILGASKPRHHPGARYAVELAGSAHPPTVYDTGWIRDFFVALAEPSSWSCEWTSRGLSAGPTPQAQPLYEDCSGASPTATSTPASPTTLP